MFHSCCDSGVGHLYHTSPLLVGFAVCMHLLAGTLNKKNLCVFSLLGVHSTRTERSIIKVLFLRNKVQNLEKCNIHYNMYNILSIIYFLILTFL